MTKRRQLLERIAYALQNTDFQIQASLLTEIVDYLPQDLREEVLQKALVATNSIQQEEDRLSAIKNW
jgi:predicted DNA-binding transcriptional regulator YafY